jgi:hypothetical protein
MLALNQNILNRITAEIPNVPWVWPLWSMIFAEQAKESHLLFSPLDRLTFKSMLKDRGLSYEKISLKHLSEPTTRIKQIIFELFCSKDLQDAIALVDGCDLETKFELFKTAKVVGDLVHNKPLSS